MKEKLLISQDSAKEIHAAALEIFVSGDGSRKYKPADIEDGSGVNARTVYSYLNRQGDASLPSLEKFLSLAKFLGVRFLNRVLGPIGFYAIKVPDTAGAYDALGSISHAGELIQETIAAAADGETSQAEAVRLLAVIDAHVGEVETARIALARIAVGNTD